MKKTVYREQKHPRAHILIGEYEGDLHSLCGVVQHAAGWSAYWKRRTVSIPICKRCLASKGK